MADAIGWASSGLLVVTLAHQVWKQWRSGESRGVSKWLFLGQLAASIGFLVYSILVANWVFVATNAFLVLNALLGEAIVLHHRRRSPSRISALPSPADRQSRPAPRTSSVHPR